MNFDVKDIKSWSNRHDVKNNDKGYFSNSINQLQNDIHLLLTTVDCITDDTGYCFVPKDSCDGFDFFLPVDAVKEEKKYRPFKDLYEFYDFISFNSYIPKEDFTPNMLLGLCFTYREKKAPRFASTMAINRIDFDLADDPCEPNIEGRNLGLWFDFSEIMNDEGEWQPFGIEVKDDE